jgi:hypothetical protein
MGFYKSPFVRLAGVCLFWAVVIFGGYKLYQHWRDLDAADQQQLTERKQFVYGRVQHSVVGSRTIMVAIARDFTAEENADIGSCDWSARPIDVKGSSGMQVISDCEIIGGMIPHEMRYKWEWEDGRGVISFSWGWAPLYP